jgi:hypothetical protein
MPRRASEVRGWISGDEGGAGGAGEGDGGDGAQSPEGVWLAPGEGDEDEEDPILLPLAEEFDATRPNTRPGFHYVGPKRASDPADDAPDFPKPAPPVVSLGASTWKPKSGFAFQSRWAPRLEPATDFPNALSGLPPPSTDLRPSWWGPTPTKWPQSIFQENWVPEDGFAKKKKGEETGSRSGSGGGGK